jgi:hypothetical protein
MPVTVADVEVCARADVAAQHIHTIASQMGGDHKFDRMKKNTSGGPNGALPNDKEKAVAELAHGSTGSP